ncbi:MAG: hypothetical protein A2201_07960, partial [Alicyclobacillus sp. RIFOXYA1_FULL_53_8]
YGAAQWTMLKYFWPLVIILFGAEILAHSLLARGGPTRYSALGVILVILVFFGSLTGYAVSRVMQAVGLAVGNGFVTSTAGTSSVLVPVHGSLTLSSGVHKLQIEVPNADVTVTGGPGNSVTYNGQLGIAGNQADATRNLQSQWHVDVQGDTYQMILNQPRTNSIWGLLSGNWRDQKGTVTVQVPANLLASITTTNGSITLNGTNQGAVLKTVNGAVNVQAVSGTVSEDTVNGPLTAEQVTGDVQLHVVNGPILVQQVRGAVNADSVNGTISVQSPIAGNWQLRTVNGSIHATVPPGSNATVQAHSIRGMTGNVAWQLNGDNHQGSALLGTGQYLVNLNTTNGSIDVTQAN